MSNLFVKPDHLSSGRSNLDVKTEQLQDIIQYSGVDLKEEAENIVKESEHHLGNSYSEEVDYRNMLESLLNPELFVEYVNNLVGIRGMKISKECYYTLFMALKRKLLDMIEKMIEISKIRVDMPRTEYIIKIENDIRRQLWCLEENEKREMEKLFYKKGDNEDEEKKKIKKTVQEREDLIIKKRLSNNVALAALGSQHKSWMSVGDVTSVVEKETPFQSLYAPFNEKEQERKVRERSITMADFIYVLEHDKRYSKSIFTIGNYF
jgi:hypothetical protein